MYELLSKSTPALSISIVSSVFKVKKSKGSGVSHCASLFLVLGPLPQLFQSGICKIIRDIDIALVNIYIQIEIGHPYVCSLYNKSLLCKIFKLFVFQIEYASRYRYYSYIRVIGRCIYIRENEFIFPYHASKRPKKRL